MLPEVLDYWADRIQKSYRPRSCNCFTCRALEITDNNYCGRQIIDIVEFIFNTFYNPSIITNISYDDLDLSYNKIMDRLLVVNEEHKLILNKVYLINKINRGPYARSEENSKNSERT